MNKHVLDGKFEVDFGQRLGKGGTSDVFAGRRLEDGAPCAVKFLKKLVDDTFDPALKERFDREIRVLQKIDHPRVVHLWDAGVSDRGPWYAMERVQSTTLRSRIDQGPSDQDLVLQILESVASVLRDLLDRWNVIHRDLKPDNIFLGPEGLKIGDFGLAKTIRGETALTTQSGTLMGTPQYIPPEQVSQDAKVDHRGDIYAFGVLGYELVLGMNPFGGKGSEESPNDFTSVMARQLHSQPTPPHKILSDISPGLEALILKCMQKNPSHRPQTWEDVLERIGEIRANPQAKIAEPTEEDNAGKGSPVAGISSSLTRLRAILAAGSLAGIAVAVLAWLLLSRGSQEPDEKVSAQEAPSAFTGNEEPKGDTAPAAVAVPTIEQLLIRAKGFYEDRQPDQARDLLEKVFAQEPENLTGRELAARIALLQRKPRIASFELAHASIREGALLKLTSLAIRVEQFVAQPTSTLKRFVELASSCTALKDWKNTNADEPDPFVLAASIYYELRALAPMDPSLNVESLVQAAFGLDSAFTPPPANNNPIQFQELLAEIDLALDRYDTQPAEQLQSLRDYIPREHSEQIQRIALEAQLLSEVLKGRFKPVLNRFKAVRIQPSAPGFRALVLAGGQIRETARFTPIKLDPDEWQTSPGPKAGEDSLVRREATSEGLLIKAGDEQVAIRSKTPLARDGFQIDLRLLPSSTQAVAWLAVHFVAEKQTVLVRLLPESVDVIERIRTGDLERDARVFSAQSLAGKGERPHMISAIRHEDKVLLFLDGTLLCVLGRDLPLPQRLRLGIKHGTLRIAAVHLIEPSKDGHYKPVQGEDQ